MGTKQASGAGLRAVYVFTLDAEGNPDGDQSGAVGYDGEKVSGARSLTSNVPDSQTIPHIGDDSVIAMDLLPPNELETASLTTAKTNLSLDAVLTGTLVDQLGSDNDIEMGGMATDKQGQEVQVFMAATRQALDVEPASASFGQRRWVTKVYPSARVVPKGSSAEQGGADENTYNVVPTPVTETPWGEAFVIATHGYTQAQSLRMISENPILFVRWTGNATLDEFTLPATPISVAKTHVYVAGSEVTPSAINTVTPSVTLASPPANAAVVVCFFETADTV
jgi:hypothetical protein